MTIEFFLACGFVAGLLVGVAFAQPKWGCLTLLAVPVAMIVYVSWWQDANPDKLRSTSALDFLFIPLWPSLSAIGGFFAGKLLRSSLQKR